MGTSFLTILGWLFILWVGTGMWLVVSGRAGFHVEMEDENEPCPAAVRLALDLIAAFVSPWWMLRERITGEPWD